MIATNTATKKYAPLPELMTEAVEAENVATTLATECEDVDVIVERVELIDVAEVVTIVGGAVAEGILDATEVPLP